MYIYICDKYILLRYLHNKNNMEQQSSHPSNLIPILVLSAVTGKNMQITIERRFKGSLDRKRSEQSLKVSQGPVNINSLVVQLQANLLGNAVFHLFQWSSQKARLSSCTNYKARNLT